MYYGDLNDAIIVDITQLSKCHYSNHSTIAKHYVKQYESSYHQATTCNDLLIFAFFFVLHSPTIVSFILLNLFDLKFHRKDNLNFSQVQILNWFNSSTNIYFHPTIKSYPLQIGFGLPPNDTMGPFGLNLLLLKLKTL